MPILKTVFQVLTKHTFFVRSPKNMRNQGTRFLRKVLESDEGQPMIPCIYVASSLKYELQNSISWLLVFEGCIFNHIWSFLLGDAPSSVRKAAYPVSETLSSVSEAVSSVVEAASSVNKTVS